MNGEKTSPSLEREIAVASGWAMLPVSLLLFFGSPAVFIGGAVIGELSHRPLLYVLVGLTLMICAIISFNGFFTLQPNEARVLVLFGEYRGTVRTSGFHWGNPFYTKGRSAVVDVSEGKRTTVAWGAGWRLKVSLRARTLMVDRLKVNEKQGNPIEIAAVVVWRVENTAQAMFDVDNYEQFVHTQSEAALRHLATGYSYDNGAENESTLRGNVDEVSQALRAELQQRLAKAGVAVDEARLTNLSYAPEIAQAMLRRQQAEAVIAARQKIVHGAVSMVDMALRDLAAKQVVNLDDDRKAAMVSNLMVVLCGESEVHPIVNAGTLYS